MTACPPTTTKRTMAALTTMNTICRFVRPRDHKSSPLIPNTTIASAKLSVSKIQDSPKPTPLCKRVMTARGLCRVVRDIEVLCIAQPVS